MGVTRGGIVGFVGGGRGGIRSGGVGVKVRPGGGCSVEDPDAAVFLQRLGLRGGLRIGGGVCSAAAKDVDAVVDDSGGVGCSWWW